MRTLYIIAIQLLVYVSSALGQPKPVAGDTLVILLLQDSVSLLRVRSLNLVLTNGSVRTIKTTNHLAELYFTPEESNTLAQYEVSQAYSTDSSTIRFFNTSTLCRKVGMTRMGKKFISDCQDMHDIDLNALFLTARRDTLYIGILDPGN